MSGPGERDQRLECALTLSHSRLPFLRWHFCSLTADITEETQQFSSPFAVLPRALLHPPTHHQKFKKHGMEPKVEHGSWWGGKGTEEEISTGEVGRWGRGSYSQSNVLTKPCGEQSRWHVGRFFFPPHRHQWKLVGVKLERVLQEHSLPPKIQRWSKLLPQERKCINADTITALI